ncbi:TadE/TadG family type IV pilus assembly protein [Bremerella sp. P1]|uniref:TadE/TadG family type IV pilus assembly protein n=1 Tax=Bremerella sp. P1 TaxID=3026424 RepID=UPI002368C8A4|nr:Tad domain-containing protein [Bremerella sp. P1]WDI42513.1 Tad domain-containing protein [Bremerella sp. P1]
MIQLSFRTRRQPRRGYVLVLFAMLFWVLLGMAALVIDLGLSRVKLRQMQSATDTAALAGLQGELTGPDDRIESRWLAAQTFHPDINQDFETYATQQTELSIVDDSPPAGGVLEDPRGRRWAPNLEPNTDNVSKGDLEYLPGSNEFYARLRHSTIAPVVGVRGDSPPLPYLFGRATVRTPKRPSDAIYRGMTIKSASLASTTRALSMGPTVVTPMGDTIAGVEFVATLSEWDNSIVHDIQPGEELTRYSVGDVAPNGMMPAASSPTGYVAIYDPSTTEANRIAGFGFIVSGSRELGHIAPENATSTMFPAINASSPPSLAEYQQLFSINGDNFVQTVCLSPTPVNEFQED